MTKKTYTIADKSTLESVVEDVNKMIEVANEYIAETPTGPYKEAVRYGIKIKKSDSNPATRMTYTYDAVGMTPAKMNYTTGAFDYGSWGDAWFIKKNKPVMLKSNGTEDYELNPDDYSKKADGSVSDYNNLSYDGNVMARIPLVYVSMTQDSTYEYITISNKKFDDTYKAIAHTKSDGSVVKNIYLACFKGYISSSKARSISGKNDKDAYSIQQWTNYATANGTGWNIGTWGQRMLINSLLWIIGRSDDTQTAFGRGNIYSLRDTATIGGGNSGYNYMIDTGNLYNKGQFFGYNDDYHQVKVFHIEGWWGDRDNYIHGLMCVSSSSVKVSLTGPYNYTGSGYTTVSGSYIISGGGGGYGTTTMTNEYGRFATAANGSPSTYTCDWHQFRYSSLYPVYFAYVGGFCNDGECCGASHVVIFHADSSSDWYVGASISYV